MSRGGYWFGFWKGGEPACFRHQLRSRRGNEASQCSRVRGVMKGEPVVKYLGDPRQDTTISLRGNSSLSHFVHSSPLPNGTNCCIPPRESKPKRLCLTLLVPIS